MKNIFLFFLFFSSSLFSEQCKYKIIEQPYRFSTYFEMEGEKYEGRVIKSSLNVRTVYDFYDASGEYIAQGVCRLISLGSVYSWARTIDLYDALGNYIGLIDGKTLTTSRACYEFYDGIGNVVGTAYLDLDGSNFMICDSQERKIASLKRNFVEGTTDDWEAHLFDRTTIDLRLFKIFSAFAVDNQEYFKQDK